MKVEAVVCPACRQSLPGSYCNTALPVTCPACDNEVVIEVFPAYFRKTPVGPSAEIIIEEGVSSCFYHEQKKAVVPCDGCGRFLCALCDVEIDGGHYCPACLEAGRKKGKMPHLETKRTLYDGAALSLALLPIVFWPLTVLTGPMAVYFGFLARKRPGSIVPRGLWRAYLAMVLGTLEFGGCGILLYKMFAGD